MRINKPLFLILCLKFCGLISHLCADVQCVLIAANLLTVPVYIDQAQKRTYQKLYKIWYARLVRRILSLFVRSPLRLSTLDLINFSVPIPADSGCVIVICHTPWKRILVQWCLEKKFALVVSRGKWMHHKKQIQRQAIGFTELRNIVRHLQQKGKVILTADNFNGFTNCPVRFLEHSRNCSTIHVRLAILAKVPIIVMVPTLNNTSIDFIRGPQLTVDHLSVDVSKSTQGILAFMEKHIEADPSLWSCYTN